MGDAIDSSLGENDATTVDPEIASSLLTEQPSDAALASAEASVMGPTSDEGGVVESDDDVGLSEDDLDLVAKMVEERDGAEVPVERIGAHKFVKFADILPPTPPRGMFDVSRVVDSAYFFS